MADSTQPLALRMRPDLVVSDETFGGRAFAVVKDPLALRYYRLRVEEFAMLELLDGRRSLNEIQTILEARYAPEKFQPQAMSAFVAVMHRAGLVVSDLAGQATPLLERRRAAKRRAWLQKLTSPLAIRLRGIDPTRAFDIVYPYVRCCFSRTAVLAATLLVAAALTLFAVHHAEVLRRLPTWQEFFTPTNTLLLLGLLGAIKVLHEFGHGLACRHFGGEVHELGLMFLVFAPCLYCNVSDAWRLPKRARVLIGAAGILVELVLAALATFGWWFSEPGLFHQLCLGTMFVSGVSTVLVNGNPLMRYDGYFIFADLIEVPNLGEKSSTLLRQLLAKLCLGIDAEPDPLLPEKRRGWLVLYAAASIIYRITLTFSIVLFLMTYLRPYRLEVVARAFGIVTLIGYTAIPLYRLSRYLWAHAGRRDIQRLRTACSGIGLGSIVAAVLFLPLPSRVWGTLELEPRDVERIYVDVPGRVAESLIKPGAAIAAGGVVGRLENVDLELEVVELAGRAASQRAELAALRQERFSRPAAALQIPELAESLAALEELLSEKRGEHERLTLRVGRGGIVLPPNETPRARETTLGELSPWYGLPSDAENVGATLETGTFVCQIGDPTAWQALVVVDQTEIGPVAVGQAVEMRFDELPNVTIAGRVAEIARRELSESPRHLSNKRGGELSTKTDSAGVERPLTPTYQVRVVLNEPWTLRSGLRGTARIHVQPEPLGPRFARWVCRTFHFDL
jgi:putative peptide zinc metalloprotease protein